MTGVALGRRVTPLSQARCQWNDSRSSGREKRLISKTIRSQIKSRFINPHNPLQIHTSAGKGGSREVDGKDLLLTGDLRSWECLPSFPCSVWILEKQFTVLCVRAGHSLMTSRQTEKYCGCSQLVLKSLGGTQGQPGPRALPSGHMILGEIDAAVLQFWSGWGCLSATHSTRESGVSVCPFT